MRFRRSYCLQMVLQRPLTPRSWRWRWLRTNPPLTDFRSQLGLQWRSNRPQEERRPQEEYRGMERRGGRAQRATSSTVHTRTPQVASFMVFEHLLLTDVAQQGDVERAVQLQQRPQRERRWLMIVMMKTHFPSTARC